MLTQQGFASLVGVYNFTVVTFQRGCIPGGEVFAQRGGRLPDFCLKPHPELQPVSFHQPSLRSDGKLSSVTIQP